MIVNKKNRQNTMTQSEKNENAMKMTAKQMKVQ